MADISPVYYMAKPLNDVVWSLFAAAYSNDTSIKLQIGDQIWNKMTSNVSGVGMFLPAYGLNGQIVPAQIAR